MGLVGKLQNDDFLVLKFRQSFKKLSQNVVLNLVISELLRHRSTKDADDELMLAGFFKRKPRIACRSHKSKIRMNLVIKRPAWAERFCDFELSCISLDSILICRVEEVSGLYEVEH